MAQLVAEQKKFVSGRNIQEDVVALQVPNIEIQGAERNSLVLVYTERISRWEIKNA